MTDGPRSLHLVRHREVRWVLFPSVSVAAFGVAVWVGTLLTDGDTSGWSTAGLGITFLSLVGIALWVVLSIWLRVDERRHAEAVLAEAIVVWPQYSTPAQWAKDVEASVEHLDFDPWQVVGPAAVFSAAVVLIAGIAALTGEPGPALAYGGLALGVVWLGAGATIVVRSAIARRAQERTRARLTAFDPFPRCWVAEDGAYFEDTGLVRFHRLSDVRIVEPGEVSAHRTALGEAGISTGFETDLTPLDTRLSKSGWALIALTSDSTMAHTFWLRFERALRSRQRTFHWVDTVHVRVPPDQVYEAHEVAARIRHRWLGTNPIS